MNPTPYLHKAQYYETDGMGIIHHSNYIRWFEEARVDLLAQIGLPYEVMEAAGVSSPVLSVQCEYKTMTRFGEAAQISVSLLEYNSVKMTIGYVVTDHASGTVRCTGETRHCFLSPEGRPLSLRRSHPEMDAILQQYLSPA